jgi:hypothetical protein
LLDKGFFQAAREVLWAYDRERFKTVVEHVAEKGSSKVDYFALVNDNPVVLCEAKSPQVMTNVCKHLPQRGIELKWVQGEALVPKILANVSTLIPLITALVLRRNAGRIVSGSEKDGMAVSYLFQRLDCMPSCEG